VNKPFITIAIPFYNAEKYLSDAVRSVFAQTHQDWELILMDDGSTDKSLEIAKSINDPRVRVYSDGKNKKLATRLNEITKLAKYDYIARMDADDLIFPEKLEVQMQYLLRNPNIDMITTGVFSVLNNLEIEGIRGGDFENPTFIDLLTRKYGVTHASLLVKKSWYERNKYNETLAIAQDFDLWLRASKNNDFKIKSISNPLYIYREEDNITKAKLITASKNSREFIKKYADRYEFTLIYKSYLKTLAIHVLGFSGNLQKLQKRRGNQDISDSIIKTYKKALFNINSTKVPGLDEMNII
jgi:glycosyltransferase involved in cell wall biosynthesis